MSDMNNNNTINSFNKTEIIDFYVKKINQFGISHETVGWGSQESQQLRFEVLLRNLSIENKIILDIGCGLGDLVSFIKKCRTENFSYIGLELVPEFVRLAKDRYVGNNQVQFIEGDMEQLFSMNQSIDIVTLSGALNIRVDDNWSLMAKVLTRGFEICKECITVNFLTTYVDYSLNKNYHFQPEKIFAFAKSLSPHVNLIHDYPLYEFTVQIFKKIHLT